MNNTKLKYKFFIMKFKIILVVFSSLVFKMAEAKLTPTELTCEYSKNNPLVDIAHPRLDCMAGKGSNYKRRIIQP